MIRATAVALALCAASAAMADCGPAQRACEIENGRYHIALPEDGTGMAPILVFLHGAGGNGQGTLRANRSNVTAANERGYAVIAPSALKRDGSRIGPVWNFYPGWNGRNEPAFLNAVIADATARFDLDPDRVLLAGFSAGAFMVSYLACATPEAFTAYAPLSGGFWRPQPDRCAGPVDLFQTHGWRDSTVPLEGRILGNGRFQQGDILAGLELWRVTNGCADHKPSGYGQTGGFLRRSWTKCSSGAALEFALFPGGHRVPSGWADMVLDWFEALTLPE